MFTLNCKGRILVVDKPILMGIINATPDSFYDGSRHENVDSIVAVAGKMLSEGATILDIGGQSTRPGGNPITAEEELKRVIEPIRAIAKNFPEAYISIDTYYARVAIEAAAAGAVIVNDISGGTLDSEMKKTVTTLDLPYVLTHIRGNPQTMQNHIPYENLITEVLDFFINETGRLKQGGQKDIIIDPGFGFGKSIADNFNLLRNLAIFKILERPLLVGISRKSTIYKTLGIGAEDALNGTTVLNTIALVNGASILRVHDIKEAAEAVRLFNAYAR